MVVGGFRWLLFCIIQKTFFSFVLCTNMVAMMLAENHV